MAVSPNAWSRTTTSRRGSTPGARGFARTPSGVKGGTGGAVLTGRCYVGRLAWRMRIAIVVPGGVDRSGTERVIPALLWLIERLARATRRTSSRSRRSPPGRLDLRGARPSTTWPRGARALAGRGALRRGATSRPRPRRPRAVRRVHAFWANNPGFLATRAARALRIPAVVSLAGGELAALPDIGYGGQLHLRERLKTARALRARARVTAASAPIVEAARARGVDADLVPLGVPPESFAEPLPRDASPRLLLVGSLNRVKDVPTALRAFRRVVDDTRPRASTSSARTYSAARSRERPRARPLPARDLPRVPPVDVFCLSTGARTSSSIPPGTRPARSSSSRRPPVGVPTVGTAVGHIRDLAPERVSRAGRRRRRARRGDPRAARRRAAAAGDGRAARAWARA